MTMTEAIDWETCASPHRMLDALRPLAGSKVIDRKLRLFACCCARRTLGLVGGRTCADALSTAELFADGLVGVDDLAAACRDVEAVKDRLEARIRDHNLTRRLLDGRPTRPMDEDVDDWSIDDVDDASKEGRRLNAASAVSAAVSNRRAVSHRTREDLGLSAYCAADVACLRSYLASASHEELDAAERRFLDGEEVKDYEDSWRAETLRCLFGDPFKPPPAVPTGVVDRVRRFATEIYDSRRFVDLPELARACRKAGLRDDEILGHLSAPIDHQRGCWALDLMLGTA